MLPDYCSRLYVRAEPEELLLHHVSSFSPFFFFFFFLLSNDRVLNRRSDFLVRFVIFDCFLLVLRRLMTIPKQQ